MIDETKLNCNTDCAPIGCMILLIIVALLLLTSCVLDGGGISPADVTATYGAEQWHAQLTAMAATVTP